MLVGLPTDNSEAGNNVLIFIDILTEINWFWEIRSSGIGSVETAIEYILSNTRKFHAVRVKNLISSKM